jgi:hypothetical protein
LQQVVQQQAAELAAQEQRHVSALVRAGDVKRANSAAIRIQRTWRRFQQRQLQQRHRLLESDWAKERQLMTAAQRASAAQTGRALMQSAVYQMEVRIPLYAATRVSSAVHQIGCACRAVRPRVRSALFQASDDASALCSSLACA